VQLFSEFGPSVSSDVNYSAYAHKAPLKVSREQQIAKDLLELVGKKIIIYLFKGIKLYVLYLVSTTLYSCAY